MHDWRLRRGLTLADLGAKVGIGKSRMADLEAGRGTEAPLSLWVALGIVIGRPLAVSFSRQAEPTVADGGHLGVQELVLGLARANGIPGTFELSTRSLRSIDVGLRDERNRTLILIEIWNRLDDLGSAARDSHRKGDEVKLVADLQGYRVTSCWILRATAANRAVVARYPNVFEAEFPGSSRAWIRTLTTGAAPPTRPGLVWADVAGTRLFEWRRALRT